METKIATYYEKLKLIGDRQEIAIEMLGLLLDDLGKLMPDPECKDKADDLDLALNRYFSRREHRYAIRLLDHFIRFGNTDLEDKSGAGLHYPEKYRQIKRIITDLFTENDQERVNLTGIGSENAG